MGRRQEFLPNKPLGVPRVNDRKSKPRRGDHGGELGRFKERSLKNRRQ